MSIDKHDIALLRLISWRTYTFTKGGAQEQRAHSLFLMGLLKRRMQCYSMKAGGKSLQLRWAYMRTIEGTVVLDEHPPAVTP